MSEAWLGKEMLRQVELRLAAQATSLAALEARAAGLLNLCGGGTLALGAAVFTGERHFVFGAAGAALFLVAAAGVLLVALRSAPWGVAGVSPSDMADYGNFSADECLQIMALELEKSLSPNAARLEALSAALLWASRSVWLAPLGGSLIVLVSKHA